MVLLNTKGGSTTGKVIPFKLDFSIPKTEEIPWNMSKQIVVGKRSDGYTVMQALFPLFEMGYTLHIGKGSPGNMRASLIAKGKEKRSGEGSSISVALRRLTIGMSQEFSHMTE